MTPGTEAVSGDAAVARIVTRLSSAYVLRCLQIDADAFGGIRAGLLARTIHTANTAHFNAQSDWGRLSADPNGNFPDDARRPISVSRLADTSGLPFETTRRIVQRLVDGGACRRVEGGVILPMATVERPEIVRAVIANAGYVRRLLRDLQAAGFIERAPLAATEGNVILDDVFAARVAARLSAEYLLRALHLLVEAYGDIRDGIIAHTIVTANTAHLDARGGEGWRYAGIDETPPDAVRRPISVARLADSLRLPFETTRRHVQRLMDAEVCIRVEGGLIVPQVVMDRPEAVRSAIANVGFVRKFVRELQAAGVIATARPEVGGGRSRSLRKVG